MDIGEAHVAATPAHGEAFVVDADQVQHGGVEVVDFDLVLNGSVAPFIGGTIGHAAFDASAGHPDGKALGIVIATIRSLGKGGTAEFAGKNQQGFIEQAA